MSQFSRQVNMREFESRLLISMTEENHTTWLFRRRNARIALTLAREYDLPDLIPQLTQRLAVFEEGDMREHFQYRVFAREEREEEAAAAAAAAAAELEREQLRATMWAMWMTWDE